MKVMLDFKVGDQALDTLTQSKRDPEDEGGGLQQRFGMTDGTAYGFRARITMSF
jgi:hypothetical protein